MALSSGNILCIQDGVQLSLKFLWMNSITCGRRSISCARARTYMWQALSIAYVSKCDIATKLRALNLDTSRSILYAFHIHGNLALSVSNARTTMVSAHLETRRDLRPYAWHGRRRQRPAELSLETLLDDQVLETSEASDLLHP